VVAAKIVALDRPQTGSAIYTATFSISAGTRRRCCCGNTCSEKALSLLQAQSCGNNIHYNWKLWKVKAMYCAITFFHWTGWTMFYVHF